MINMHEIKHWLAQRHGHQTLQPMLLLQNIVLLIVSIILFFTVYSFAPELNEKPILFIQPGGLLLIGILLAGLYLAKGVYVGLRHAFHGATNLMKVVTLLLILIVASLAYFNQGEIKEFIEKRNTDVIFSKINPLYFSEASGVKVPKLLCADGLRSHNGECIPIVSCTDGTLSPDCSSNRPYQCLNGELEKKASVCGCPYGDSIRVSGDDCADLSKPGITFIEMRIHELVNIEREKNGLSQLAYDDKLADIARAHSQDMAEHDFFSHTNLSGQEPTDRAKAAGYPTYKKTGAFSYTDGIAENIAQNNLYDSTTMVNGSVSSHDWKTQEQIAQDIVTQWMNSPGHRANILDPDYDKEGLGVAISSDDEVLATQNFW